MKELKCPKCGSVFSVDEADYASILNQVKNQEFEAELKLRMTEMDSRHKAEQQLASAKAEQAFQYKLNQKVLELGTKDSEIERLRNQLKNILIEKENEKNMALAAKDQAIAQLNAKIGQHEANLQIALLNKQRETQEIIQQKGKGVYSAIIPQKGETPIILQEICLDNLEGYPMSIAGDGWEENKFVTGYNEITFILQPTDILDYFKEHAPEAMDGIKKKIQYTSEEQNPVLMIAKLK